MHEAEPSKICKALAERQVKRKFCIKLQTRQINSLIALIARYCGYDASMDEEHREKAFERSRKIFARFPNKNEGEDAIIAGYLSEELKMFALTQEPLIKRRAAIEKEMRVLATLLPIYPWAKSVRGLGELGLAVIIGEAGDLSRFPHERMLWKRLGLAPYSGKAMSNWHGDQLTAEEWIGAGYSKKRRAEIHACVGEPLFRAQTQSTTNPAAGPYRLAYDARRAHCEAAHPDWPKGHLHGDALRIMTKKLLSDLWSEWRWSNDSVKARARVATASVPAQAGGDVQPVVECQIGDGVPETSEGERVQFVDESQNPRGPSPSDPARGGAHKLRESQMRTGPAAFAPSER